ncbi:MAG: class I SAM-dependent methyltransferase [Anaerolineales bacterium]|nr:class I SAM-dependent methyltransferase [Anaerolineales bacterium]
MSYTHEENLALRTHKHGETWMSLEEVGNHIPPYRPTYDFPGPFINRSHRFFSTCPVKDNVLIQVRSLPLIGKPIPGWLRREDALKLYEMAYFAQGDILELGSYQGLSTCILAQANRESPHRKMVYSVDLDAAAMAMARRHLWMRGLSRAVRLFCGDALELVRQMIADGRKFAFVFVDHSHAYEPVYQVCCELERLIMPGGFCLFHDFNDARNRDAENRDYGVYQAVRDGLNPDVFEFYGIYGCAALYRTRTP